MKHTFTLIFSFALLRGSVAPLVAFLLFAAVQPLGATDRVTAKPNIILILADDVGYGDFSIHGNPHVRTPVLDRFAREGIQFERFYVSPVCAPTRASLLTGRWWQRGGVWTPAPKCETMRAEEVTIAEVLRGAGYRTGIFGKWHNGDQYPYTPEGQGFDEFLGFRGGHLNLYFDAELLRGSKPEKTRGYITDVLTDEAIAFIERNHSAPFFCYLPYNAAHSPYQVPDPYFNRFKALGLDDKVAAFWGMCGNIDDNVARVLATLDRLKLRENTIVLFLTDNGGTAGVPLYNAGMRGGKGSMHEGGTRVPLFLQWPARFKQPRVVKEITAHVDLMPTLLELCGVRAPAGGKFDGRSLVPLLEGRKAGWPERFLFTHFADSMEAPPSSMPGAVRSQRYRLVNDSRAKDGALTAEQSANWQLYDMVADPGETKNVAGDNPEVVLELRAAYEAWWADVSRTGFTQFPIQVGHDAENPVELAAPQAFFSGLKYYCGPGFAHDWLTGWTSKDAKAWFDIEVVQAGDYEIALKYLCPEADAGSRIRVSVGDAALEAVVSGTAIREVHLPHRDQPTAKDRHRFISMEWATLPVGKVALPTGRTRLEITVQSKPGQAVMDLKGVILHRGKTPAARPSALQPPSSGWRGVFFNPQVGGAANFPWLLHYDVHRAEVQAALSEMRATAGINLVDVQVLIPHSLRIPAQGNRVGERVEQWANLNFLDDLARFVDDCHMAKIAVELDLVDNRWIPPTVAPDGHIGKPGNPWWPQPSPTPWDEAAEWYVGVIQYVEAHAAHPESIAMWCMFGNHHSGAAEPVLWDNRNRPEIRQSTERFVKIAWPAFRSAGKRPKAAPILLPIFSDGGYWQTKTPADRLSAFTNLKRWLVDDLKLPPDYWVMSTYPNCDPAPDGFRYLHEIVEILGPANAARILSTDLKGEGHENETRNTILNRQGRTGADILRWHIAKCREYGFAGWWMWAYQDTPASRTGLRTLDGRWKEELVSEILKEPR
jgi:arylsulfatase A